MKKRSTDVENGGSSVLAKSPKSGLLLLDLSLQPIAYDRGAVAILKTQRRTMEQAEALRPPREILDMVSLLKTNDQTSINSKFRIGGSDYNCTSYLVQPQDSAASGEEHISPTSIVAVHIEKVAANKVPSFDQAVSAVATKYSLTEREREVLVLLSLGLCGKEMGERMNISPNTVKVFLRLIMLKIGVSTRGEIIAEIIQNQNQRVGLD